jgi:acetolactate synthase-1/2/3 large subunit
MFYNHRYSATVHPCPDFALLAKGFGATGLTVKDRPELADAIAELLKQEGPAVLDVQVEPEENVYPMVHAGRALHEMDFGTLA